MAQEPVPESKVNQETEEDAQGKQETQGQQEPGVNQVPKSQGRSLVCRISLPQNMESFNRNIRYTNWML